MDLSIEFETEQFERWVDEFTAAIPRDVIPTALKKLATDFLHQVIDATPLKTGRARGGWGSFLVAEGVPIDRVVTGDAEAVRQGLSEGSYEADFDGREQFIELVNGVEYIVVLEYGHSAQAPYGFVRVTFRRMEGGDAAVKAFLDELDAADKKADRRAGYF